MRSGALSFCLVVWDFGSTSKPTLGFIVWHTHTHTYTHSWRETHTVITFSSIFRAICSWFAKQFLNLLNNVVLGEWGLFLCPRFLISKAFYVLLSSCWLITSSVSPCTFLKSAVTKWIWTEGSDKGKRLRCMNNQIHHSLQHLLTSG